MSLFVQLLLNGLVAGSVYALVAVGFALIFGATRHFHIAHAGIFASGGYLTYLFSSSIGLPAPIAAVLGIALAVLLGVLMVRVLYVPLNRRGGQGFILFLVSLGLLTMLDNIFTIGLGAQPAKPDLGPWFTTVQPLGTWSLTVGQIVIIVLALTMFAGLVLCLDRTRAGKLVKAYSGNPEFFEIFGLRPSVVLTLVYAVGSLFAAVAGTYMASDIGMQPGLGEQYFIVGIMAVFIGGIGSIRGAFTAAMLLGVLQNLLLLYMGAGWTLAAVFAAFLIFITISPEGLQTLSLPSKKRSLS